MRAVTGALALCLMASAALAQPAPTGISGQGVLTSRESGRNYQAVVNVPSFGVSVPSSTVAQAPAFAQVAPNGQPLGQSYVLAKNVNAAGAQPAVVGVPKDSYFYTCSATTWNGASAQLQFLGPDGVTYYNFSNVVETANPGATGGGPIGVGIGANATVRVLVTGTPTGLNCSLT